MENSNAINFAFPQVNLQVFDLVDGKDTCIISIPDAKPYEVSSVLTLMRPSWKVVLNGREFDKDAR